MRRAKRKALLVLLERYHYRVITVAVADVDVIAGAMSKLMLSHGRYDNVAGS